MSNLQRQLKRRIPGPVQIQVLCQHHRLRQPDIFLRQEMELQLLSTPGHNPHQLEHRHRRPPRPGRPLPRRNRNHNPQLQRPRPRPPGLSSLPSPRPGPASAATRLLSPSRKQRTPPSAAVCTSAPSSIRCVHSSTARSSRRSTPQTQSSI